MKSIIQNWNPDTISTETKSSFAFSIINIDVIDYLSIDSMDAKECTHRVWYDYDQGVELTLTYNTEDLVQSEQYSVCLDGTIGIRKHYLNDDGKVISETINITDHGFNEESFFMESTMQNFGTMTFEDYVHLKILYRKVLEVVAELEKVNKHDQHS